MDASPTVIIERLTDELRQLVGRGVWTMRLITLPTLRELSRVDDSLSVAGMASAIRDYLVSGIASMANAYEFQGNALDPVKLRWVLRILLGIEGRGQCADKRRARVLRLLGLNYSLLQFRRPISPERELLRLLATHLVAQSGRDQTAS